VTVLGVDTSSRQRIVAVLASEDGALLRASVDAEGPVDRALPRMLQQLLIDDVTALVAVTGPGSYTGLRAGMAAALGIAHTRRMPLHTVGTLDVVAAGIEPHAGARTVAADAGRGAAYVAECMVVDRRCEAGAPQWVPADRLAGLKPVASIDKLAVDVLIAVDAAAALAASVRRALTMPAVSGSGLTATYID
jgi:tRNA threonylcarbamoyladenosine biosynthesis protein TsaB